MLGLQLDKFLSAVILSAMPRPSNDHDAWEHELREDLPAQLAAYQQELAAGLADKTRREFLEWQIRHVRKRVAELAARLKALR